MSLSNTNSISPPPFHPYKTKNSVDLTDYIEQARLTLDIQRINFERERAAFAEERKLWEKERHIMQQRIADLEAKYCNDTAAATNSKSGFHVESGTGEQHHVWEGSSPTAKPSRVFLDDIPNAGPQLPRAAFSPSLDEALSPKSRPTDRPTPIGIPVELVDSSLDGITLKSTALSPSVAAKVSPPLPTAPATHLSAPHPQPVGTELNPGLFPHGPVCVASPFGEVPSDMDHTPMPLYDQTKNNGFPFPVADSIPDESPPAPLPSLYPVASFDPAAYEAEDDDDPALRGLLGLQNDQKQDTEFLEELDQKLLREAQRALSRPSLSSDEGEDEDGQAEPPEPEPEIRFKPSTNFGTAYGSTQIDT